MTDVAQAGLFPASQVAQQTAVVESPNGIFYGSFGDTHVAEPDLARVVQAVPATLAKALARHAYYFVPLTIADEEEVLDRSQLYRRSWRPRCLPSQCRLRGCRDHLHLYAADAGPLRACL
jgi:hypothetical protein